MKLFTQDWLLNLYYEVNTLIAGVKKHSLSINNDTNTMFSYYEKGKRVLGQSTMIFIHGFSSNKESWLSLMKNIPNGYHCIIIDLPCHGETIELKEDDPNIDTFLDKLKLFFDKMNLIEPMYIIGTSLGATVAAIFATKYPKYVNMMCLLAPAPIRKYESDLIKQIHSGREYILLPETSEQFHAMAELLTINNTNLPKVFVNKYFKSRLRLLNEQKEILRSFLEYDYLNLEQYYEQLKYINYPVLILWGRQDQLCEVKCAEYFSTLIPNSEVIIFDDCGHFISYDKPEETAKNIIHFLDFHSYCLINL
ncbi:unnamed protein product [Rotaria sordida]|uniref:acylglycerol lipase n=1 Tax=Rotaria sordida TaxID=392033 RepID=A0A814KTY7_9BILA|nr:unnamed protein product [Rotaria sordida]CAF3837491.1 unnamed protein product [Rotaria sordida]